MLSRKQLRLIQQARGLSMEQIVQRTGIPNQSLMALMHGADKDGKDPNKLISQTTFEKVLALMGIDKDFQGLRPGTVIEWKYQKKKQRGQEHSWREAVVQLRKCFFSESVQLAELTTKTGLFKHEYLVFVYDPHADLRIVICGADKSARSFLESVFGVEIVHSDRIAEQDFVIHQKLVENSVYRVTQFDIVQAGKTFKYNWADVQAAAKEFNFSTETLIDLMVETVRAKELESPVPVPVEQVTMLRRTG